MSEYSARQEAWMARVAHNTPPEAYVCLGWPKEAYSRPVKGHWTCKECGETWLEYTTGTGTFTEDDFIEDSCSECGSLNTTLLIEDDWEPDSEDGDDCFSWAQCDLCGTTLGGSRHAAVFLENGTHEVTPISICVDCLMYHDSGEPPDEENLTWL